MGLCHKSLYIHFVVFLEILASGAILNGCSKNNGTDSTSDDITTNRYLIVAEGGDLYLVDLIDESTFHLTGDEYIITDYNAQFVNDGRNIVWQRHEDVDDEGTYEVWMMNSDASGKFKIFCGLISPMRACSDNDEIIMCDTTNMLRIYSLSGDYLDYLAADGGYKYLPQWSPDGSRVAYLTGGVFCGEPTSQDDPNITI